MVKWILLFLSCVSSPSAWALDFLPETLRTALPAGRRQKFEFVLVNEATLPVTVKLEARVASFPGEKPWLSLRHRQVRLEAGERRTVPVMVRAPHGLGERRAELLATAPGPGESTLRIRRQAVLTISGTEVFDVALGPVSAKVSGDRVLVEAAYLNRGNVTVRPRLGAELELKDGSRAEGFKDKIEPALAPGARGLSRFEVPLGNGTWTGRGTVTLYYPGAKGDTVRVRGILRP